MASWFDSDNYFNELGKLSWNNSLRSWAQEVSFSHLEIAAVLYSYAIRQLKYEDTDKDLAMALLRAAIEVLNDN